MYVKDINLFTVKDIIMDLIDLALITNDKEWFRELCILICNYSEPAKNFEKIFQIERESELNFTKKERLLMIENADGLMITNDIEIVIEAYKKNKKIFQFTPSGVKIEVKNNVLEEHFRIYHKLFGHLMKWGISNETRLS